MNPPTRAVLERLVGWACRGPSVHNTQPWRWRICEDGGIELWADRERQLRLADPAGRNLSLSCGAALHHLAEAGRALGMCPAVELLPHPAEPDLLARVRLTRGLPPSDAAEILDAMVRRCTDRRRFTSWPIPDARLTQLTRAADGWGAFAVPVFGVAAHLRTELLLGRAQTAQEADARYAEEQQAWVDHSAVEGIPRLRAAPASGATVGLRPNRFAPEVLAAATSAPVEASDGLVAICTADDDPRAWLQAGQALSALWLRATREGFSLVPLSQAIEVEETRHALHHEVFGGTLCPQLLVRVGWQEIARATLPATSRRPLDDVLLPDGDTSS